MHGYRTIFPVPIAIALSWEPEQSEKTERISAIEASNSGLHRTFAPMIDVARDPHRAELSRVAARMHPLVGVIMDQQKLVNGPCTKYIYCLLCDYED